MPRSFRRILFLSLLVMLVCLETFAIGQCIYPPDGNIVCGAVCGSVPEIGSLCEPGTANRPAYCYEVWLDPGYNTATCHDGEYDPCCCLPGQF